MDTVLFVDIPESVAAAQDRASKSGFEFSSEAEVGQLMACLANAVPIGEGSWRSAQGAEWVSLGSFTASDPGPTWR